MPSTENNRAVRGASSASDCSVYSGKTEGKPARSASRKPTSEKQTKVVKNAVTARKKQSKVSKRIIRKRKLARFKARFRVVRKRAWRRVRKGSKRLFYAMAIPREKPYAWRRPMLRRQRVRNRNRLVALAAAVALLIIMLAMCREASKPSAVVVVPSKEMPCVEVFFNQQDPAWSDDRMGDSGKTIGENGDTLSCLASLIAMQQIATPVGDDMNPGTLNAWLSAYDGYDGDGELRWERIADLLGVKLTRRTARRGDDELIDRLLDAEFYPIVEVLRPDTGRMHSVLIVGSVHGEYTIVDPLDGMDALNTLGLYENAIYTITYLEN